MLELEKENLKMIEKINFEKTTFNQQLHYLDELKRNIDEKQQVADIKLKNLRNEKKRDRVESDND